MQKSFERSVSKILLICLDTVRATNGYLRIAKIIIVVSKIPIITINPASCKTVVAIVSILFNGYIGFVDFETLAEIVLHAQSAF